MKWIYIYVSTYRCCILYTRTMLVYSTQIRRKWLGETKIIREKNERTQKICSQNNNEKKTRWSILISLCARNQKIVQFHSIFTARQFSISLNFDFSWNFGSCSVSVLTPLTAHRTIYTNAQSNELPNENEILPHKMIFYYFFIDFLTLILKWCSWHGVFVQRISVLAVMYRAFRSACATKQTRWITNFGSETVAQFYCVFLLREVCETILPYSMMSSIEYKLTNWFSFVHNRVFDGTAATKTHKIFWLER